MRETENYGSGTVIFPAEAQLASQAFLLVTPKLNYHLAHCFCSINVTGLHKVPS